MIQQLSGVAISKDLATASKADPEPISKTLLGIAATVAGFFGAAHLKAVAKEGQALNVATPTFISEVQQVMDALNQGAISEQQAIIYLQQSQSDFEAGVKGVIKDNGKCFHGCNVSGSTYTWQDQHGADLNNANPVAGTKVANKATVGFKTHCCNSGSVCNGPCCIRCGLVVPTVENLTMIIQAGGGSYTIPPSSANAANKATPPIPLSYMRPSIATTIDRSILGALGLGGSSSGSTPGSGSILGGSSSNSLLIFGALGVLVLLLLVRK